MRENPLNTNEQKLAFSRFLLGKLDEMSFAKIFRIIYKHIDYNQSFASRMPQVNGHASPWAYVCYVVTTLGRMLRDLALKEVPMNPNINFTERSSKRGGRDDWVKDMNMRVTIDKVYNQLGASANYRNLDMHDFVWKPIKHLSKDPKKKGKEKAIAKRKSDADLMDQYTMPMPDDLLGVAPGPSAPKSPRIGTKSQAGRYSSIDVNIDPALLQGSRSGTPFGSGPFDLASRPSGGSNVRVPSGGFGIGSVPSGGGGPDYRIPLVVLLVVSATQLPESLPANSVAHSASPSPWVISLLLDTRMFLSRPTTILDRDAVAAALVMAAVALVMAATRHPALHPALHLALHLAPDLAVVDSVEALATVLDFLLAFSSSLSSRSLLRSDDDDVSGPLKDAAEAKARYESAYF